MLCHSSDRSTSSYKVLPLNSNTKLTGDIFLNILCCQNSSDVISPSKNGNFEFEPNKKPLEFHTVSYIPTLCNSNIEPKEII